MKATATLAKGAKVATLARLTKAPPKTVGSGVLLEAKKYVDLTDAKGWTHILDGDATGGGHGAGRRKPGKSEFPADWSDDRVIHEISDIATDPKVQFSKPDKRGYSTGIKTVDGVDVKVVVDQKKGRIVSGYPTNVQRNP